MDRNNQKIQFALYSAIIACKRAHQTVTAAQAELFRFSEKLQEALSQTKEAMASIDRAIQDPGYGQGVVVLGGAKEGKRKRASRKTPKEIS
jgi:hypothetical protein